LAQVSFLRVASVFPGKARAIVAMRTSSLLRLALGVCAAFASCGASPVHKSTDALMVSVQSLQQTAGSQRGQFTPGLSTAVDALLSQLQTMRNSITSHHQATQAALNTGFETVQNATDLAVQTKNSAVPADQKWVQCVSGEKVDLQEVETAQTQIDNTVPVKVAACRTSDVASRFSVDFADTSLTCDQRVHNCADKFSIWAGDIDGSVNDVQGAIGKGASQYKADKRVCDTKTELVQNLTTAHGQRDAEWIGKRADCHDDDSERVKDICAYGFRLQEKCSAEVDFSELLNQVLVQTNTSYSLADMRSEWSVVQTVSCMLTALKDNGQVLSTTDCQTSGPSLDHVVGALTTHEVDFNLLVSKLEAKCQPSITFSGSKWTFPPTGKSTVVNSTQYALTKPWTEDFSQTGTVPFVMCQAVR